MVAGLEGPTGVKSVSQVNLGAGAEGRLKHPESQFPKEEVAL